MSSGGDSPVRALVSDVADRTRKTADYLADRGPEGLLADVQDFARRRPVVFLAAAAAAGFVVGRLGKGIAKAKSAETGARRYDVTGTGTYRSGSSQWLEPAAIPVQPSTTAAPGATAAGSPALVGAGAETPAGWPGGQAAYADSGYSQPGYDQRGYQQPGYDQPAGGVAYAADVEPGYGDPLRTYETWPTSGDSTDAERGRTERGGVDR
jgi:hypothetical protein